MKAYWMPGIWLLLTALPLFLHGQEVSDFRAQTDSLKALGDSMVLAHNQTERDHSCYAFIKTLVRTLKADNSYSYKFDSLRRIQIIYAPDNTFRIFCWQITYDEGVTKYFGAIQKNARDLDLYPLFDKESTMQKPEDTAADNNAWYGAIYYKIIQKKSKYFLLGWRNKDYESNVKVLDVLQWNDEGKPVFGDRIIEAGVKRNRRYVTRLLLEYKGDAVVTLNEDPETHDLVFDHLVSANGPTDENRRNFIPDGSYDALKFKGGRWHFKDNIYKGIINKEVPVPAPIDFNKVNLKKHAVPKHDQK